MLWIYQLPTGILALLILASFLAVSLGGLVLSRRYLTRRLFFSREINEAVNYFGCAVAALYSVTLGLIAVASWTNYNNVQSLVSQEAATIGVLYRDVGGYPEPLRAELRRELRGYTEFVVARVWPAQRQGVVLDEPTMMLARIHQQMLDYEPATMGRSAVHAEALRNFSDLTDLRRQRIDAVDRGLPGVLWAVVCLGGLLTLGVSYFFWIEDVRFHALLLSLLTVFVAMMIFLIAALDRPFLGTVSVSADSYRTVIDRVMNPLDTQPATP